MLNLAQTDPSPMLDSLSLGSISGIVGVTMFIVEILKRVFKDVGGFNKIPTFAYAIVIAGILAFAANVLGILPGSPALVIWASVLSAAGASGFYTWLRNPEAIKTASTLGSGGTTGLVLVGFLLMSTSGCATGKRAPNDTPLTNDSRIVYTTVLKELTSLKNAGLITAAEKQTQIEPIRIQASFFLNQMENAEIEGNGLFDINKQNFQTLVDKLIEWRVKASGRK